MTRHDVTEQTEGGWRASAVAVDVAIALAIFCAATWIGVRVVQWFRDAGGVQEFYQSEYGPAVMFVCGRGLHNPDTRQAPALAAFLSRASDSFACSDLPPAIPAGALTPFQTTGGYLQLAVALTWKVTGISWSRLAILNGVLFGCVATLTYCVFRLALWRSFALLAMLPALMWSPNLMLAPQLRDYAKGPFLLAVICIMGVLVVQPADRLRTFAWSSMAGMVIGAGFGFRADLMIGLLPMALTIVFLLPATVSIPTRLAAVSLLALSFVVVALPALGGYAKGGNTGHVSLLGLSSEFDRTLRLQPSIYRFVDLYNDTLAFSIVNGFAVRFEGKHDGVDLSTADYDRTAASYLRELAATFPADVVTRTLAAMRVVPRYFLDVSLEPPLWAMSGESVQSGAPRLLRTMYWLRGGVSARLAPLAVPAVIASILGIAMASPRAAWLAVLVVVSFAGASAIQFHERHFYYLLFIPWLAFGIVAQALLGAPALARDFTMRHVRQAVAVGAALAIAAGGAVLVSRVLQQRSARRLFEQYESARRAPLRVDARPAGSAATRLTVPEWNAPLPHDAGRVVTRFVAVQFLDTCPRSSVDLTVRYEARDPDADLSETMTVPMRDEAAAPTRVFIAAYDRGDESIRFRGFEVGADRLSCIAAVFSVAGLDRAPILLNTTLAGGWRQERLYQRVR